ncbi:MAG: hypothetical protein JXA20_07630 [Spirochaetes bacterium]|nr:hypothetical protein [Spirochaetota bacterium]
MRTISLLVLSVMIAMIGCVKNGDGTDRTVLISKRFTSDSTYSFVCKGFPKEELTGPARMESAKRAALLNVYYYAQQIFDDTVAPDRDGRVEKYETGDDYATVYYEIRKQGLRRRLR